MSRTIYDPIVSDVGTERRKQVQEDFGRHLVEQRNQMAELVRKWIETDTKFPIPIYDRLLNRIKQLDPAMRADIASISLLMADQIVTGVLFAFSKGDEMQTNNKSVNYAVIAQLRNSGSDEILEQIDVNRGEPALAVGKAYTRWLSRYAPSSLRTRSSIDLEGT
jgi:hypothetical protein